MRQATTWQAIRDYDAARLEQLWPHAERLQVAFRLAKDLAACEELLKGAPVDPGRVRQDELQKALEPRLVQLVRPIDVLHGRAT